MRPPGERDNLSTLPAGIVTGWQPDSRDNLTHRGSGPVTGCQERSSAFVDQRCYRTQLPSGTLPSLRAQGSQGSCTRLGRWYQRCGTPPRDEVLVSEGIPVLVEPGPGFEVTLALRDLRFP
jgi:hypothetical protein